MAANEVGASETTTVAPLNEGHGILYGRHAGPIGEGPSSVAGVGDPESASDTALIFVHSPKTAGTTLSRILDREYNPFEICNVDCRFYYWSLERIRQWPAERLARIRLFKGHMPFGLHRAVGGSCTYITLLRDPVDRTISEYYARRSSHFRFVLDRDAKDMSLEDYVATVPYNNPQTKMLAGVSAPHQHRYYSVLSSYFLYGAPCSSETLEVAKENLVRHFSLVGISERLDETLALGKILFGWKVRFFAAARRTHGRPLTDELPSRLNSLIAERHRFDMELYAFARSLFAKMLAERAKSIASELVAIRDTKASSRVASVYQRLHSIALRQLIRVRCAL